MKFAYTIFYVENLERTLVFYQQAFTIPVRFVHESGTYAEMETGETTLAFATAAMSPIPLKPAGGCEICFTTDDVATAVEEAIDAGATLIASPEKKPWGQTVAYVQDPEGILIELATPIV